MDLLTGHVTHPSTWMQAPPSDKTALEVVLASDWEREMLLAEEERILDTVWAPMRSAFRGACFAWPALGPLSMVEILQRYTLVGYGVPVLRTTYLRVCSMHVSSSWCPPLTDIRRKSTHHTHTLGPA